MTGVQTCALPISMTAIACFIFLMVAEFEYTVFTRLFYFAVGG